VVEGYDWVGGVAIRVQNAELRELRTLPTPHSPNE
jgi:hypothetical protein